MRIHRAEGRYGLRLDHTLRVLEQGGLERPIDALPEEPKTVLAEGITRWLMEVPNE